MNIEMSFRKKVEIFIHSYINFCRVVFRFLHGHTDTQTDTRTDAGKTIPAAVQSTAGAQ